MQISGRAAVAKSRGNAARLPVLQPFRPFLLALLPPPPHTNRTCTTPVPLTRRTGFGPHRARAHSYFIQPTVPSPRDLSTLELVPDRTVTGSCNRKAQSALGASTKSGDMSTPVSLNSVPRQINDITPDCCIQFG
ncbi:hypothetical protein J6590_079269 [Homalodisca vitripennis]|nr:hypothetical protein J6590_079269 [Homalodisca vitripennis]